VILIGIRLSLLVLTVCFFSESVLASEGKISMTGGYFGISAKANGNTANISNPSAFRLGYQHPISNHFELVGGYTIIMADFSGSDLGYGLDVGANYFPLTFSHDEFVKDPHFEVKRFEQHSPYVGLGFYQRQFQSVQNSYAGLGATVGLERYHNKKINFKAEVRYITLAGSGDSEATEMNFMLGIVYKL
jgi:hypothetical protein